MLHGLVQTVSGRDGRHSLAWTGPAGQEARGCGGVGLPGRHGDHEVVGGIVGCTGRSGPGGTVHAGRAHNLREPNP